ncbi:MAG: 2Fe-2S iron-sulfur cluster-binding protein [Cyanobacteria bacterium J06642_2]
MPIVYASGQSIFCERGANLRRVLLDAGIALHNGKAAWINCRGLGSCGTCAVRVEGKVSEANWRDRGRRSIPPHDPERGLRLACQTQVLDDVRVTKFDQFWGQGRTPVWTPERDCTPA